MTPFSSLISQNPEEEKKINKEDNIHIEEHEFYESVSHVE